MKRTIEEYVAYFRNMSEAQREDYFMPEIQRCKNLQRRIGKQYCKKTLLHNKKRCIQLMVWAPEGKTRPHEHLYRLVDKGAPATIYVLRGGIVQDLFAILDEGYEHLESNFHHAGDEPIIEDPSSIHRIGNASLKDWTITIHEFVPGFQMLVYDFGLNLIWIVDGKQDTLDSPPENALPIWPRAR